MLSIDEVIARERQQAKKQRSRIGTWGDEYSNKKCEVYAEYHEQLAEWLEELKDYRDKNKVVVRIDCVNSDEFKDILVKTAKEQYNKAIDDAKSVVLQTLDNEILVDTLHLRLEQLKEQI